MGAWNAEIKGNDTFLDIYQAFFDLYNQGHDPKEISQTILKDFNESFNDSDDRNNSLFGLALAQWETKTLDPAIFKQVKEIIETGSDLNVWSDLGADEKTLKKRQMVLDKFLRQISIERDKPKRRVKTKFDFKEIEIIKIVAPDNRKFFEVSELYTNGIYEQTASMIMWDSGDGGSVFYFEGQGQFISASWLDNLTLEVIHEATIVFTMKEEKFGKKGKVIYLPK